MASFGQKLRQAREARNITLQEIAATTKIGTRTLQALEWERFEQLPGGIFNKGFVRAYARCVGLNEEETVAAYMEAANVAPPETDLQALASQVESRPAKRGGGPNAGTVVGVLAVLVALGLGALWLREHKKESREAAEAQQSARAAVTAVAPPVIPAPAPNPATVVAPTATDATQTQQGTAPLAGAGEVAKSGSSTESDPVEISISANAKAWISVLSDGKPAETVTLDPDKPEMSSRSYKAKDRLKLILGNPAGVTVTYNGKPAGELGTAGKRTVVTFTPEGIEKQ